MMKKEITHITASEAKKQAVEVGTEKLLDTIFLLINEAATYQGSSNIQFAFDETLPEVITKVKVDLEQDGYEVKRFDETVKNSINEDEVRTTFLISWAEAK